MAGTTGIPAAGERDIGRSLGDGVPSGDAVSENSSASERVDLLGADAREAKAAAVAAAASSTVPVWWF
jgi:hypothetical protein